jgi:hypothetical protein
MWRHKQKAPDDKTLSSFKQAMPFEMPGNEYTPYQKKDQTVAG